MKKKAAVPLRRHIVFFGQPRVLACDANCRKAWGINSRPHEQLSTDPDDYAYWADGELGEAPVDPGTYEGEDAKPVSKRDRLNKWCARECERSVMVAPSEPIKLRDFSRRVYNVPRKSDPERRSKSKNAAGA